MIVFYYILIVKYVCRFEHHENVTKQKNEPHVEVQHHVGDESDGHTLNHTHPKLDLKNFHTQLW